MLWIHRAQAAATAAVAAGVAVAGFAAAAPAVAGAAPRSAITSVPPASHTVKPVPVRPPSSPGVVTGGALPAKPRAARQAAPDIPDTGWTVSLAASPATLWPTQYSTLTATTNMDVGPTPYWIQIYDESTGSYVASCASGTSCSISVTEPTTSLQEYTAVVADGADSYPPGNEQAVSSVVAVDWQAIYVSLSASPTTVAVDYSTTLTATASTDVGPTPFSIEIYDVTSGSQLWSCASGTTCTVGIAIGMAVTDEFVAYVSTDSTAFPPSGIQATSADSYVTWADSGWQVSLSGPGLTYGQSTYTATANGDVGPTPYWIEIFDETTGDLLAACPSGSSCPVSFTPGETGDDLVAFVTSYTGALSTSGVQASSNVLFTYFQIIP